MTAEALREAAKGWRAMGRHLEGITQELDQNVRATRETHWRGPAADAFGEQWTRLKGSVDDALPVFELAAAGLDDAADRADRAERSTDAADTADAAGREETPTADDTQLVMQIAYAANLLSQLGAQLGGTRRKTGTPRGRSAPTGPLPAAEGDRLPNGVIGLPSATAPAKEKPSGGLGIAAGARTPAQGDVRSTFG